MKIEDDAFWIDVRTPEEFAQGHAEGSINIPLDELIDNLDRFQIDKQIIVFCKSGIRSEYAKEILYNFGFYNVINCGTWQDADSYLNK